MAEDTPTTLNTTNIDPVQVAEAPLALDKIKASKRKKAKVKVTKGKIIVN